MSGIMWLASYPKSGNTWMRIFIQNYLKNADQPINLAELDLAPVADSRHFFDEATGVFSADLSFDEVDQYRPMVYIDRARSSKEILYHKTHDAYTYLPDGRPLMPPEATCGVIYIIRNPLDVVLSYASHNNATLEETIENMNDDEYGLCVNPLRQPPQLRQKLLSWSDHVQSWIEAPNIARHIVRYEDLIANPVETFTGVVHFLGMEDDAARIRRAVEFSSFKEVQKQERESGFREKSPVSSEGFFRKGKVGGWREQLSSEQIELIVSKHRTMMRRFGYLTDDDQIV